MINCAECKVEISDIDAHPLYTPLGKERMLCLKCYIKHIRGQV